MAGNVFWSDLVALAEYSPLDLFRLQGEHGYLYAAAAVFGVMVSWVNQFPMLYKHKVMRINSGNLRANMMIYKELGAKEDAPYIGLETEGPVGCYNRANRSLFHFTDAWQPERVMHGDAIVIEQTEDLDECDFCILLCVMPSSSVVLCFRHWISFAYFLLYNYNWSFNHTCAAVAEPRVFQGELFGLCCMLGPCWYHFPASSFSLDHGICSGKNDASDWLPGLNL